MDKRQIKAGVFAFLFVLFCSMIFLKPYLPSAVYHNFATIMDYKFFQNRVVPSQGPGVPWPVSTTPMSPPDQQLEDKLDGIKTTALLVLDHGAIAYEKYSLGGGQDEISGSFSMAKSIVSLLTGFALQERKIDSLDEPVDPWFPEWSKRPPSHITIRNLLTMSSGLNWEESYWNPFSVTAEAYFGDNILMTAFRQRPAIDPGTTFQYQSGTTQLLGILVSRAAKKPLSAYASEKLWIPLGAERDALWSVDHEEGTEKAYCCFNARARDFARLGQLVLNTGKWNGVQLLNADYIKQMTTPNMILDETQKPTDYYGYQWWVLRTPTEDIPYARGILGQYIIVIPSKERVVVRLGMNKGKTIEHHPEEVRALVEWALK